MKTKRPLLPKDDIRVIGAGKFARGRVERIYAERQLVEYRDLWGGNLHLVPLSRVRLERPLRKGPK